MKTMIFSLFFLVLNTVSAGETTRLMISIDKEGFEYSEAQHPLNVLKD